MRRTVQVLLVLAIAVAFAAVAFASDHAKPVTVTGKVVCAKCSLHKADAKDCQNVLVATVDGKAVEYYIAKNPVSEAFGHVCGGEKNVVATGTLHDKDGKTWIEAKSMEPVKTS